MKSLLTTSFVAAVLLAGSALHASTFVTVDFETYFDPVSGTLVPFARGDEVTDQYKAQYGMSFAGSPNPIWIFDTNLPTTGATGGKNDGDPDLATPNPAGHPTNTTAQDNVIVVQENLGSGSIPDDIVGSEILVTWDLPVILRDLSVLDIESSESAIFNLYDGSGNLLLSKNASGFGDSSFEVVSFGDIKGVQELEVILLASGAIPSITFQVIPEPQHVALMGVGGLALVVFVRRRRQQRQTTA